MKVSNIVILFPLLLLTILIGCGENGVRPVNPSVESGNNGNNGNNGNEGSENLVTNLNGTAFIVVNKSALKSDGKSLSGSGSVVFAQPLKEDDNSYSMNVSFEPGGSVTLVALSNNTLQNGISLTYSRTADDTLGAVLTAANDNYDFASDSQWELSQISTTGPLTIKMDVHGHGDAIPVIGEFKLGSFFKTKATGKLWGLVLNKAVVTQASAGAPMFPH